MLRKSDGSIIPVDDYTITQKHDGINLLTFDLPDDQTIYNEVTIIDTVDGQAYLVKVINGDRITAELDLDGLRAQQSDFDNGSATPGNTLAAALVGTDWTSVDQTGITARRTITGAMTPLAVIGQIESTWDGITATYDNAAKVVTLVRPGNTQPAVTFLSESLNLRQLDIEGDSSSFCTRLRAKGADGMTFAAINDGKDYVENHSYSDRIIYGTIIEDDRFTDPQSLKDYAQAVLDANAVPAISYNCEVIDLAAIDAAYNFQQLAMHKSVWLLDKRRNTKVAHRVVQYTRHPMRPELNTVTLSTVTQPIQNSVTQLQQATVDPNGVNRSRQAAAIANATNWLTGVKGGHVIFRRNDAGQPTEILIMDTDNVATAQKVWRWNLGGFAYSSTGVNGPYTTAITQDGAIVADFISTGTLSANLIKAGVLESLNGSTSINMETGVASLTGSITTQDEDHDGDAIHTSLDPMRFEICVNGIRTGFFGTIPGWPNPPSTPCVGANMLMVFDRRNFSGSDLNTWIGRFVCTPAQNGYPAHSEVFAHGLYLNDLNAPKNARGAHFVDLASGKIICVTDRMIILDSLFFQNQEVEWLTFEDGSGNTFHVLGYYG